jgi:hypothetical protein
LNKITFDLKLDIGILSILLHTMTCIDLFQDIIYIILRLGCNGCIHSKVNIDDIIRCKLYLLLY